MDQIFTLITGADKGIGFETAKELGKKGHYIFLGSRDLARGKAAVQKLISMEIAAEVVQLDVTKHASLVDARTQILRKTACLNILINNAGVAFDGHREPSDLPLQVIREDFEVNFFGNVDTTQVFLPLLRNAEWGKIINLSSDMGSLTLAADPHAPHYKASALGYQASKAAVNFATICFSKELAASGITVNSVNPGWTATEFGGRPKDAAKLPGMPDVSQGAARIVALASSGDQKTTGTFSDQSGELPW